MDKSRKSRTVLRCIFTKTLNSLKTLLESGNDIDKIKATFRLLEVKLEEIQFLDKAIYELALESNLSEEELVTECEKSDEYFCIFQEMKSKLDRLNETADGSNSISSNRVSLSDRPNQSKRKFKLPYIELRKFDGELINWLPFWSQFSKVHNDADIAPEDKFQYLLQSVQPGTRAYDLVHSFPPTEANYNKAIHSLKDRFGKDDLLVEVYVRELLKIVLQNAFIARKEVSLQQLYDKLESHLRALETLGVTTDKCAALLYPLVESCMPEDILRAWQRSSLKSGEGSKERLDNVMKFVLSEVEGEQRIGLAMSGFGITLPDKTSNRYIKKQSSVEKSNSATAASLVVSTKTIFSSNCIFCDKNHKSSDCFAAQKMTLIDKNNVIREKGCCFRCLRKGHSIKQCKSKLKCALCKRSHFTLMCPTFNNSKVRDEKENVNVDDQNEKTGQDQVLVSNQSKNPSVFMQTLVANLRNPGSGKTMPIRVLFDTGSQCSYALDSAIARMGYESLGEERITHSLFGNVKSTEYKHNRYRIHVSSRCGLYMCNFQVLDQPEICGKISHVTPGPWTQELADNNIVLTDVEESSLPIGILIGADVAGKLFTRNRVQLSSGLVALETLLGWTIMGKVPGSESGHKESLSTTVTSMFVKQADISDLWNLDTLGINDPDESKSKEERATCVKEKFLETTKLNDEGRFEVRLPWIDGHPPLPTNLRIAEKRLTSVAKKLEQNDLFSDYDAVFKEWFNEGIIELVPENEVTNQGHYLPHRPVIKEGNITTRIRPVFDASAREISCPSLNDCLESGPNLIELIPSVILRFREGKFGVIADIRRAFLQISINPEDRDYLRFLWFDEQDQSKAVVYRHRRVVFGVKCSPFLLGAVLELHLQRSFDNNEYDQQNIKRLQKSFYVDNVSTSTDTEEEMYKFIEESKKVMTAGKFELRGWVTSTTSTSPQDYHSDDFTIVLGMKWNRKEDVLSVDADFLKDVHTSKVTKRTILSVAHRIFDPIGYTTPVTLCPKLLLQKTWILNTDWDTEVNKDIYDEFMKWFRELSFIEEIRIPRWLGTTTSISKGCSLHTFCDGSKDAYAAAVFIRIETKNEIKVQLVSAKSRVVPLKKLSIPRIELLAATIGARLAKTVITAMDWHNIPLYLWTDSSTVLAWIQMKNNWSVFVWNRISEIRKLTKIEQWNHIPGESNPADLPSRGCNAKQLFHSKWWEGPEWLRNSKENWPITRNIEIDKEEVNKEVKKSSLNSSKLTQTLVNKEETCEWCETSVNFNNPCCKYHGLQWYNRYFSQYQKIVRLVAWTYRFLNNCKLTKKERKIGELNVEEVDLAEKLLLKQIQKESFNGIDDKKISNLFSIIDEEGLIRLKTKLCKNDEDEFGVRYPILLPSSNPTVRALILDVHKRNSHAGVQLLMNIIREKYWVIGGRRSLRYVISRCVVCKKLRSRRMEVDPGVLPVDRMKEASAFEVTGTDLAGPLFLKEKEKAWVCIFTCAVYRAVHFELITSLSTDSFLQAFRRFISRRGRPTLMYSDNGSNYVGANNALKTVNWEDIAKYSSVQHIDWKFNPPSAPWWGGWWERIVRLLKELLKRVLGKACLNYQELTTVLCDCEAVINERPLTYVYDKESELIPLTPSHFLHEIREIGVPDIDNVDETSLNRRIKRLQHLRQDLRQRFKKEYLGQLIHKGKSISNPPNLAIGDIVLVECDNVKRIEWPLAKVIETIVDQEGVTRLARLKTQHGFLFRPVQKLFPLELSSSMASSLKIEKKVKYGLTKKQNPKKNVSEDIKMSKYGRRIQKPVKYSLFMDYN